MAEKKSSKQPSLHWPGWIWVMGIFVFSAIGIAYILGSTFKLIDSGYPAFYIQWQAKKVLLLHFVLFATAAVMMLINRKMGWVAAIVTLVEVITYCTVKIVIELILSKGSLGSFMVEVLWITSDLFLTLAIPLAWLIYFIIARKRYGIGA